ncbi:MAG: hypothetical protein K9N09_10785 [Candidatus Cloacimonetes bacterium]|nr:hypothetical protein [Candidatus Cloacimonadota bacterium]MCF7813469.1 hypothetical protein [Candidatus Cloacimonadota bacterium]MCF7869171.1 hypothetical protein [Candidatus Cloacimonadota bacterium]MCF7883395.1 hypothetical protein [Candidatus Cloacimonadota bacterium]
MQITIDKKEVTVTDSNLNLVQIAKENGITIPAPCFLAGRPFGCCQVCAIEINNAIQYACCTKPQAGMEIIVNRDDLNELRKLRMQKYQADIQQGTVEECNCSSSASSGKCGCGEGCC